MSTPEATTAPRPSSQDGSTAQSVRVAIIGSGFAGIGAAIRLKQAGIDDFVVLERADDLGGTWRANHYPGLCCDVPSHVYSFSFELNPHWKRGFAPGAEIKEYIRTCAEKHDILPRIRYRHEVLEAAWDEGSRRWRIETSGGNFEAQFVISGAGALSDPSTPDLPGVDRFQGKTFHSMNWDHEHDLGGERVAVIGTGASAIQFVPQIQPQVEKLHLFQRTPPWIVPGSITRSPGPSTSSCAGSRSRRGSCAAPSTGSWRAG